MKKSNNVKISDVYGNQYICNKNQLPVLNTTTNWKDIAKSVSSIQRVEFLTNPYYNSFHSTAAGSPYIYQ